MSRIIEKKTWPEMFAKILDGSKNFDLRLADFEVKEGDVLLLKEWDPQTKKYTGREVKKIIRFVLRTKKLKYWSQEEINNKGFVVMSLT